ncbi:nicotinate-nucleotide--dimethylbenzimidazole phosphoribosyltransferase [Micromonospora sp. NPDC092111]|uniref:nicotinate-nucleotide--dimethylbenzimidazole phosphoribosyltransferase n=1 Tax=Micromonospora sp. NPDC092111 TaxID=3364289 RepID=UPI0037FF9DE7
MPEPDIAAVDALCATVPPVDPHAVRLSQVRQRAQARPPDALGTLDAVAHRVAGIRRGAAPGPLPAVVSVLAGDHGVARHGTSRYRHGYTGRVLELIRAGLAPVCTLAARVPARVECADVGLAEPVGDQRYKIGPGTRDITRDPAMAPEQVVRAVLGGARYATERLTDVPMVAVGEIGVGNTTAATALAARLLDTDVADLVGAGSGVTADVVARKRRLIDTALTRHAGVPGDPLALLAALGGFEIAGNVGVILAAAGRRQVVVIDGTMTAVAALVAVRLCPASAGYLVAGHRSTEPAHQAVLADLGLPPLLDLGMRLGMAAGAVLALHLINGVLAVAESTPSARSAGLVALP